VKNSIFQDQHTYSSDKYDLTLTSVLKNKIEKFQKSQGSLDQRTGENLESAFQLFHFYLAEIGLETAKDMMKEHTCLKPILDYVCLYRNDQSYILNIK
jgi:hypothetical protein